MKKATIAIFIATAFITSLLMATPAIQSKHTGLKKKGNDINCAYCHDSVKIKKDKGYGIKKINKNSSCKGSGCHPLKK